ncbi:hypothetical protein [Halomonas cibimaris]
MIDHAVHWRSNQGGLFPLSPPGTLRNFDDSSAKNLLEKTGKLFCRWETCFGQVSDSNWWHIIKDKPEVIENLPKKTRYMIRKADKAYEARPVELSVIRDKGYPVYVRAYERYDTHEPMFSEKEFRDAIETLPAETEWWGVFNRETNDLVAFSENYVENGTCFYVTMWLEPEAMAKFVGYLIFHEMELHYLQDRGFQYVSDGARSLSHDTNIHDFLIRKFNFRKAYAKLHVVYKPWLGAAVSCAYPFRNLIGKVSLGPFKKASILLKQEEIRRSCARVVG